jgi:hypothetical protein
MPKDQEQGSFWSSFYRSPDKPRTARAERLELLVGILGFFTLVSFLYAVVAEVRGHNAVWEVLVLVMFGLALYVAIQYWRRA